MKLFWLGILALAPSVAAADATGVWRTEADSHGSYLEVTFGPCTSDAGRTCGVISKAYKGGAEDTGYAHLGKTIVANMAPDGQAHWSGGTIWDPESDKTYRSKMSLKGEDELDVDGCVAILCDGQAWQRVR